MRILIWASPASGSCRWPSRPAITATTLSHYRALVRLRQDHPALRAGGIWIVESDNPAVYGFLRHSEGESLLVLANLSRKEISDYTLSLAEGP